MVGRFGGRSPDNQLTTGIRGRRLDHQQAAHRVARQADESAGCGPGIPPPERLDELLGLAQVNVSRTAESVQVNDLIFTGRADGVGITGKSRDDF